MSDYVGVIDESQGAWGVRIPDLPGCYGAGDGAEAAIRDAASAAREWIVHQESQGTARPKARTTSEILGSGEIDAAADEAVSHSGADRRGRTVRANLTFDAGLLGAIDAVASERGLTRSRSWPARREKISARR